MPKVVVDHDVCDGDGVCADVCPMNVFDIVDMPEYNNDPKSVPERQEDCILCMACVSACPTQAITVTEE
ncbi:MAG: ferredoxin family protein [Candidatus Bathyarchaeota archaeon]|jgi:NAD-dependent dihydropyrimidine dehydrogenase PreA subunit